MKKIVYGFLISLLCIGLIGCDTKTENVEDNDVKVPDEEVIVEENEETSSVNNDVVTVEEVTLYDSDSLSVRVLDGDIKLEYEGDQIKGVYIPVCVENRHEEMDMYVNSYEIGTVLIANEFRVNGNLVSEYKEPIWMISPQSSDTGWIAITSDFNEHFKFMHLEKIYQLKAGLLSGRIVLGDEGIDPMGDRKGIELIEITTSADDFEDIEGQVIYEDEDLKLVAVRQLAPEECSFSLNKCPGVLIYSETFSDNVHDIYGYGDFVLNDEYQIGEDGMHMVIPSVGAGRRSFGEVFVREDFVKEHGIEKINSLTFSCMIDGEEKTLEFRFDE